MLKGHKLFKHRLRGDTLIEVMFAVGVFGLAAIGTVSLMNRGLASSQNTLEVTMARQEIDAQAESLRFLQSAYMSDPKKAEETDLKDVCDTPVSYRDLWRCLVTQHVYPSDSDNPGVNSVTYEDRDFYTRTVSAGQHCDDLFRTNDANAFSLPSKSFILNPRRLDISDLTEPSELARQLKGAIVKNTINDQPITLASTYPRLIYDDNDGNLGTLSDASVDKSSKALVFGNAQKNLYSSEGIWITGVASPSGVKCVDEDKIRPDYYDFHIQTCWDSMAGDSASTIGSTVRLFNPDQTELGKSVSNLSFKSQAIAFLIDVSGSMHEPIKNARSEATATARVVLEGGGRVALYSYSDANIGEETIQYCSFSNCDANDFYDKLSHLSMMGGGDIPESAVYGAMKVVNELDWDKGGAIVIFTDAPTHGAPCSSNYGCNDFDKLYNQDQLIAAAVAKKIKIYVVNSDPRNTHFPNNYEKILSETGGKFFSSDIASAFEEIAVSVSTTKSDSGCYRVENQTSDDNSFSDGTFNKDDNNPTPDPTPEPTPEPTPTPQDVEETIEAIDGGSLQTFDMSFDISNTSNIGIKKGESRMVMPSVVQVASDSTHVDGTCSIETNNKLELHCSYPYATKKGSASYSDGRFVIYLDKDSLTDDSSVMSYGTGPVIQDFWNYKDLKITIYFYDRIRYFHDTVGHEEELARYKITSDSARVVDSNGRYWIIARVYGNPNSTGYWAEKLEIINQRTNRDPSSYL